jgi:di/tricarboxylate transporter
MEFEAVFVLALIVIMIAALVKEILRTGIILFSTLSVLMAAGVISAEESLAGFSNKGAITVAILFLVSEGVRQTGAINIIATTFLPKKKTILPTLLLKIMLPVSFMSAFLNNTPIVIIFGPIIKKWADKMRLPASKFLIPLSYATMLGGMCTLIGTSTNLVVHGLMLDNGFSGIGMFEIAQVGVIVAFAGFLYLAFIAPLLLPGRKKGEAEPIEKKTYFYNISIPEKSSFVGKKIVNGHFPEHHDIFVTVLERNGKTKKTTSGETVIKKNDKLVIRGNINSLQQLISISGITIEDWENIDNHFKRSKLQQVEAVVSDSFPGIGQTLNEFNFYSHYRAIVAAIHRNGEEISTHTGDIPIRAGDNLILLATQNFVNRWSDRRDFYLVSETGQVETPVGRPRLYFALVLILLMIAGATFGKYLPGVNGTELDMFYFAAVITTLMFWTTLISAKNYTRHIDWDVLITIACAFGVSKGMQNSGLADIIAYGVINSVENLGPVFALAGVYLVTTFFTEVITNNAAAALVFPIALSVANQMGINPQPFFITICVAASASFATPIGYQTNLIVQSIGNYKFKDYLRVGIPLNIITFILSMIFIPRIWGF